MSHLRVVGAPESRKRRKGVRPPPVLSAEHQRAAKASIRGLAAKRFGSIGKMSKALGYHEDSIQNALNPRGRISPEILLRVALACSVPVETMITPGPRVVTS